MERNPNTNGPKNDKFNNRRGPKRNGRNNKRRPREQKEFEERVVTINRITKVVKGDRNGKVGLGTGKANEVPDAIRKASEAAKKNLITVPMKNGTIPHEITGSFKSGHVFLRPAAKGTGIIAGGPVRAVVELAGYTDILSKSLGSRTPINMVRATVNGLAEMKSVEKVAELRDKTVEEIYG